MADEKINDDSQEATEEKFDCTINIDDAGVWKKKISVVIPRTQIDKELESQYGELMTSAEVPGFRKGRAPKRLVEKRFGEDINNQAKLRLIAQAFESIDDENDFDILGEPDLDIDDIKLPDDGELTFEYEVEIRPQFDLPELEGIKIEKKVYEVSEKQVNETLDNLCQRQGRMEDVDDGAKEEDFIKGDVTLKVEGVEEPETKEDTLIRCSSTAIMGIMLDDMGKVLNNAKAGDIKTTTVDVPDTHANENYRGKKAEFTINVKGVRRLIPAEINEEFLGNFGVSDEKELRQLIEQDLESQGDKEVGRMMSQQVYKFFEDNVVFDLPEGVASRHAARVLQRQYYDLLRRGVPQEQINENIEKLRASSTEESARQLKMSFIMDKVAEKLEINVSEAEINGFIAQIAATYGRRPERVRDEMQKEGRLAELNDMIRDEKAVEKILEMAEVVDAPVESDKKEENTADKKTTKKSTKKTTKKTTKKVTKKDSDTEDAK